MMEIGRVLPDLGCSRTLLYVTTQVYDFAAKGGYGYVCDRLLRAIITREHESKLRLLCRYGRAEDGRCHKVGMGDLR
jgi:hypothetical protein